jgi:flavodoxin
MELTGVVYATKTRHSKKIAEAIAQALGVKADNIEERPVPQPADLLFIVGGIYGGQCHPALLTYAEKLDASLVKRAVLVTSSVSVTGRKQTALREVLVKKGVTVADELTCTGALLFVKLGHPNKADIQTISNAAKALLG